MKRILKNFHVIKRQQTELSFPSCIQIQSPETTINECESLICNSQRGVYLRFGDGDVNLLNGQDELFQKSSHKLAMEMQETFDLRGNNILKGLPLNSPRFSGVYPGMRPGVHASDDAWSENLLSRCYPYFIGYKIYSSVALAYISVFNQDLAIKFLRHLRLTNPIFVGNEKTPPDLIYKLFDTKIHVKTPSQDSFSAIDQVENSLRGELEKKTEFQVVVLAMGCSGRILQKRIYNAGYNVFLFDFGSLLDALCGWNTRAWIELCSFDNEKFLEKL